MGFKSLQDSSVAKGGTRSASLAGVKALVRASGGTESTFTGNGTNGVSGQIYRVHTFTTSGTLTVTQAGVAEVLIVAGGGDGANYPGGGGGHVIPATIMLPVGANSIIVGAKGQPSSAFGMFAVHGENGGYVDTGNAGRGGVSGSNYLGGTSWLESGNFGGGGGAGYSSAGSSTAARIGGNGGAGLLSYISGSLVGYGGGGGGYAATGPAGTGQHGGGDGNVNATANTGGGGGGNSKLGASGIVIVRYPIS